MDRYNVKSGSETVDLIGIRRVQRTSAGSNLRYWIAREQVAYSPTRLVAWQGRYSSPDNIERQQSYESESEFITRFERTSNWN